METKTQILSPLQVKQKIERIAHEIWENDFDEKEIVLVGIANRGYQVAEKISAVLKNISPFQVELLKIELHKDLPLENDIVLSAPLDSLNGKTIVLIDDVLNSGRTLIYAARYLLTVPIKKLNTVVLVDRRHRKFPIKADFVGLTLSTTLKEHISVEFEKDSASVYLD